MANALTCIIVDDSYLDRLAIEVELEITPHMKLLGSFESAVEAVESIKNQRPDVLFLDVDMPEIGGLQLFRSINNYKPICIVISSHPEYAIEGFELKVFDYLLKPLASERFSDCIKRLNDFLMLKEKAESYDVLIEHKNIVFKQGYSVITLNIDQIIYLEAFGDYTKIVTNQKTYLTLTTLSNFLGSLPAGEFMRIHRSYVVAVSKVHCVHLKSIDMGTNMLPIGKTYLSEARQIFKFN